MKELIFKLSNLESIKIIPDYDDDFKDVEMCCSSLKVYFVDQNQQLRIGQETAGDIIEPLMTRLKKCINGKLQLHESITQNIGFMENEYSHDYPDSKTNFFMIPSPDDKRSYWIGSKYEVWTTYADARPYVNTWLYNDHEGNIILEVTPFYKWSMQPIDRKDPDYITYKKFMKNYKPLLHRVIPHDVAIKWFDQALEIYKGFFKDEEVYKIECKRLGL